MIGDLSIKLSKAEDELSDRSEKAKQYKSEAEYYKKIIEAERDKREVVEREYT